MNSDEINITLSGNVAQGLRAAFPAAHMSLSRKAEKIIAQWLEDNSDIKAANAAEQSSQGKPNIRAEDLFAQCGL